GVHHQYRVHDEELALRPLLGQHAVIPECPDTANRDLVAHRSASVPSWSSPPRIGDAWCDHNLQPSSRRRNTFDATTRAVSPNPVSFSSVRASSPCSQVTI